MNIVLGGSRHIHNIPSELIEILTEHVNKSDTFLIGDAPGSDTAFQRVLANTGYKNIKIFSSAGYIRNNIGRWEWELVPSGLKSKSNAAHAFKDRRMCELADSGLMLWDCQSAGTLSNVIELIGLEKTCGVWVGPESEFYRFDNPKSFDIWVNSYSEVRDEALNRLMKYRKREKKRKNANSQPKLFS